MNPKIYFYYLIIILISFSCHDSPTGGDGGTTTTGGEDCGDCPLSLSIGNISNGSIEIFFAPLLTSTFLRTLINILTHKIY